MDNSKKNKKYMLKPLVFAVRYSMVYQIENYYEK